MPIEYKLMHKVMMDMATMVVHQVEVILEVMVMVICLEEDVDRLFVITITNQDM